MKSSWSLRSSTSSATSQTPMMLNERCVRRNRRHLHHVSHGSACSRFSSSSSSSSSWWLVSIVLTTIFLPSTTMTTMIKTCDAFSTVTPTSFVVSRPRPRPSCSSVSWDREAKMNTKMAASIAAAVDDDGEASTTTNGVVKAGFFERINQGYQSWALRRRWKVFRVFVPPLRLIERLQMVPLTTHAFLVRKRAVFGDAFCAQGCVVLSRYEDVESALTSPQARTTNLGAIVMEPTKLPDLGSNNGRMVFLLALSQLGAGGTGDHEAFQSAVKDALLQSDGAKKRLKDDVAKSLLKELVQEYEVLGHSKTFFEDARRGLHAFLMKFLHHVVFDIDPYDHEKIETLTKFHYDTQSPLYYLKLFEKIFTKLRFTDWVQRANAVIEIYKNSPCISSFPEGERQYRDFSRHELAGLMTALMAIAALVGPKGLLFNALGYESFPAYHVDRGTEKIDVTKVWDGDLDLDNREDVKKYLFEVGRLKLPVATIHKVATEDFTVMMGKKERTFPKGTKILIPMSTSMVDETFWGATAFDFDRERKPGVCPYSMMFNSVGDRDAGRMCPGRDIAVEVVTDVIVELGKARRGGRVYGLTTEDPQP